MTKSKIPPKAGKLFILVILLLVSTTTFAQVDTAWVRRYNGLGDSTDIARSITVDGSENVYVTGVSYGGGTNYDLATIKYYPNGDTAWVRRYNGPGNDGDMPYAIAVDGSGNVYVTGTTFSSGTDYDCLTIKYYPSGDTAWVRTYNGPGIYEIAEAIRVDGSNNVYVTGTGNYCYVTIKYYPNGDTAWVRKYGGWGGAWDVANAIGVDGFGNAYITGGSFKSYYGDYDYATIKYYPNGDTAWVRRYDGPGNTSDDAQAIAVDGSGNVHVTGYSGGYYATIKYYGNGDTAWVRRYGYGAAYAIAVDGSDNIYVTGLSSNGKNYCYATIKYYPDGDTAWVRMGGTLYGLQREFRPAMDVDGSGNVYVTGITYHSGTSEDYMTIKYYPNGDTAWVRTYNGPWNSTDDANAITVDCSGNVYVTGSSYGIGTDEDYATVKYVQFPAENMLFFDNFACGNDDGWEYILGSCTWSVVNEEYTTGVEGNRVWCISAAGDINWRDYIFEADVYGVAGVDKVIAFRLQDENNFYAVNLRSDWGGLDQVTLNKMENGVFTADIMQAQYPSQNGRWYHLKVGVVGDRIVVWVNDNWMLDWPDEENTFWNGKIAVCGWSGDANIDTARFDNILVTDPFPKIIFDNYYNLYTNTPVTIEGHLEYYDGRPYVPQNQGDVSVIDPISGATNTVPFDQNGHFSYTTTKGVEEGGLYFLYFFVATPYLPVKQKLVLPIENRDLNPENLFESGLKLEVGPVEEKLDNLTNTFSFRIPEIPPPPGFLPWEVGKGLYKEIKSFVKAGWQRVSHSWTGQIAIGINETALKNCSPVHMGSCAASLAAMAYLGHETVYSSIIGAFDVLWQTLEEEGAITPSERQYLMEYNDLANVLKNITAISGDGGLIKTSEAALKVLQYDLEHAEILELKRKRGFGQAIDDPITELSAIARNADGDAFIFSIFPKKNRVTVITGYSPIDLIVTDPIGRIVSKETNQIDSAEYIEADLDYDGKLEDKVIIPSSELGEFQIQVIPDSTALPSDSFTLTVQYSYFENTEFLAQDMLISEIPPAPFTFQTFENLPPDSFNLISPNDTVFSGFPVTLTWETTMDPNPGQSVYYYVVITTSPDFSDSVVFDGVIDTFFTFDGSLEGGKGLTTLDSATYFWKVYASDAWGLATASNQTNSFGVEYFKGDANGDGVIDISDVVYLINYLFIHGPAPVPLAAGDATCDGVVDVSDVVYLINYLFVSGPPPGC
jgi:hypothetical protein